MPSEYKEYIVEQTRAAWFLATERAALVFGLIWNEVRARFSGFWFAAPLFWVSVFWAIDFALGSGRALYAGEWKARRSLMSGFKLAGGCCVLLVSHAMRDSHLPFASIPASLLETVVLFAEFSSVLIHVGELTGIEVFAKIGRAFRSGSDRAARKFTKIINPDQKEEE